jgi:hypothetical protein
VLGQVEDQQRAHAVVGEALPHLGEEQHVEALGVAHELRLAAAATRPPIARNAAEHDDRDGGDPVAFVPQSHVFHAARPQDLL